MISEKGNYTRAYALIMRAPVNYEVSRLSCILESRRCEGVYCLYAWPILHTHTHTHTHICNVIQAKFTFDTGRAQCLQTKCAGSWEINVCRMIQDVWRILLIYSMILLRTADFRSPNFHIIFYISGTSPWSGPDSSQGIYSVIVWREQVRPW
jgi:hypothetical protein